MAISKRTRYEVLRRDGFTCRYCGSKDPNVELHVDHVMPTALGGSDKPDNLVASCADCNFGKASTDPDAETVADVSDDAERWARAIAEAARRVDGNVDDELCMVYDEWESWQSNLYGLPDNWRNSVRSWLSRGATIGIILEALDIAWGAYVPTSSRFRYMAGVVNNKLRAIEEEAQRIIEQGEI